MKSEGAVFAILIVVHGFEAIVLRMDETVFGENRGIVCEHNLFRYTKLYRNYFSV